MKMEKPIRVVIALLIAVIISLAMVLVIPMQEKTPQSNPTPSQNNSPAKNATGQTASGQMPPAEAISACTGKSIGATCQFENREGTLTGICNDNPGVLACAPNRGDNPSPGQGNQNQPQANNQQPQNNKQNVSLSDSALNCVDHTKDNPQCKDCCDCLADADGSMRTACRDTCAVHDFSQNSDFITVTAPSILGKNGDYSQCVAKASSGECKDCCEGSLGLQCGDYQYCRTACNNKFGNASAEPQSGSQNPPPQGNGTGQGEQGQNQYTITQAISDQAQLNTMAFDGLGFLTGNTCSDSFLPPGKVADFFGFQHLRDITANGKGHDTDFVTNCANNVLKTLSASQRAKLMALAKSQGSLVNQFAYDRFPLMVAFRRQLEGDIPVGSSGLSKSAVMDYSADLYAVDANISIQRAELYAEVINSLDSAQRSYLDSMVSGGFASWPSLPQQVDSSASREESVLIMTYASEMFGWYAGDLEADTYFCPERQADYFGGFYIKDAPAIGNAGYTIDESITGDQGQAFLNALDTTQKNTVTSVIDTQRDALNGIVEKRREISAEFRKALSGGTIDESKVISLAKEYGALDGEISYYYAMAFSNVGKTLTASQESSLTALRGLSSYPCPDDKAYLYSEKIEMPSVEDTDFLFE